ncbi:hypothetical protein ACIQ34_08060 [Ureibacillus sp. NPDC094379]
MSYPFIIAIYLTLLSLIVGVTYFFGKKRSNRLLTFTPVIVFGTNMLLFYIKHLSDPNHTNGLYDLIAAIILTIVFLIAMIEVVTHDIVENGRQIVGDISQIGKVLKSSRQNQLITYYWAITSIQNKKKQLITSISLLFKQPAKEAMEKVEE